MKIQVVDSDQITPICPHCDAPLETVYRIKDEGSWLQGKKGYCYVCSNCHKVLGFADFSG